MPRVLFVHHRPQLGGAARSLATLASALDSRWELHAVVPEGPAADLLREAGVTVHPAPVPAFTHTWDVQYRGLRWLVLGRELAWAPRHTRLLGKALRDVRPDLVHLNDSVMLVSGAIAARAGVPVVWHLRSSLAHGGRDRRSHWVTATLDRYGTRAIAIDEDVAATFPLRIPIDVIPNPVAVTSGPLANLAVPDGRVAIGYFGYLRRQKGWPEFLDAMRILVDQGVPAHAVVVGGGVRPPAAFRAWRGWALRAVGVTDEQTAFASRRHELGLDDRVTSLPFVADPAAVLRALDLVVFPNQGTGLGRPVLEAAAYGKPVVASGSTTGAAVLIPELTGLLLAHGTAEELANALARLIGDPDLRRRLGIAAAAHAAETSAPGRVASSVTEIWARALDGKPEPTAG